MNKSFLLVFLLVIVVIVISSCGTKSEDKLIDKIIFAEGGDFLNLSFGETKESVKTKLPSENLDEDFEDYLMYDWVSYLKYSWWFDKAIYNLDLYFDEENNLFSISGNVLLEKEDGTSDNDSADKLFIDLKQYLVEKFGKPDYESADVVSFNPNDVEVSLEKGSGQVNFSIAQYAEYDSSEYIQQIETTEEDTLLEE